MKKGNLVTANTLKFVLHNFQTHLPDDVFSLNNI